MPDEALIDHHARQEWLRRRQGGDEEREHQRPGERG
jgi:hypothetical protein